MSVLIAPETVYGKELWKWDHHQGETHPNDPTIKGMRPMTPQAHPAMMYKALQKNPWKFEGVIAADEVAQRNLESRGFVYGGQGVAAEAFDKTMQDNAMLAAARNYEDRNMSEKARAESNAAEQASSTHLPTIPETPIKRRGRKAKVV